jgi:serine/threonine-protein kinase
MSVGPAPLPTVAGYEVLGEIGRGGMGVVFKARHLTLNRVVALKVIADPSGTTAAKLVRFRQEAEAVAKLQHPNIVQIFETGVADGRPYLALEHIDGGTLKQKTSGIPQPPRDAARTLETVARAVHHAHEQRIVHRDLKPHNILLTSGGVPKVTDFGLARTLDSGGGVTMTTDFVGTPAYSAPEQVQNRHHDIGPATDVYALGATLYELLTGHPPFESASLSALLRMVVEQEPTPIRRLRPDCPRDLETVCLKCLQKEPGLRYGSAAALADDLRRYQADEPISARPVRVIERGWRLAKRNPVVAGLVAAVGLLLLTGAIGGGVAAARFKERADDALKAKKDADAARHEVGVQLWRSQLNEARANTRSGLPGQRFASLELLKKALATARESGLSDGDKKKFRDVAAAALALGRHHRSGYHQGMGRLPDRYQPPRRRCRVRTVRTVRRRWHGDSPPAGRRCRNVFRTRHRAETERGP